MNDLDLRTHLAIETPRGTAFTYGCDRATGITYGWYIAREGMIVAQTSRDWPTRNRANQALMAYLGCKPRTRRMH